MRTIHVVLAALALAITSSASGEEFSGIEVYPGAKRDPLADAYCKAYDAAGEASRCFRTSDGFEKVAAFYSRQPALKRPRFGPMKRPGASVGIFCARTDDACTLTTMKGTQVVLMQPWTAQVKKPVPVDQYENKDVLVRIVDKDKLAGALNRRLGK